MAKDDSDLTRPKRAEHGYSVDVPLDDLFGDGPPPEDGGAPEPGAAASEESDQGASASPDSDEVSDGQADDTAGEAPETVAVEPGDSTTRTTTPGMRPKGKARGEQEPAAVDGPPMESTPSPGAEDLVVDAVAEPVDPAAPARDAPPASEPIAVEPAPLMQTPHRNGPPPLVPSEPLLGLSDLLRRDAILNVPKWRGARAGAAAAGMLGLVLAVVGAARWRAEVDAPVLGPLRIGHVGLILAMLSVWAYLTIRTVAGERVLRIPLAPNQHDQWEEVQSQARLLQFGTWIGLVGGVIGLGILALSLRFLDGAGVVLGAGLGGTLAVASLGLVGFMEARRGPMRAVYVQTLLLSRLEEAGVSDRLAVDPRTARVIQALDRLLADLPESSVRRFLSSDEAEWYLDLIERSRGGDRGG